MGRGITIGLFVLLSGIFPTAAGQSLRISPKTVDLGEIPFRSKHRIEVVCKNEGDRPLVVRNIETGCVCTKPSWSKKPVMPGDSVTVVLQFSATERGAFYKTVTFETTPVGNEKKEFIFRGKVY